DLKEVADTINLTNVFNRNFHFKLMADITTPVDFRIGLPNNPYVFNHTFDGNEYKIKLSLNMPTNQCVGLFSTIASNAVIKNLSVDGEVIGETYVGGITGRSRGTINNCINYANITSVGEARIGGIAGDDYGQITFCINYGTIKYEGDRYLAEGTGGIIGISYNNISYNINCGDIISGSRQVGGIVGSLNCEYQDTITVKYCLNIGRVAGTYLGVGGIIGFTPLTIPAVVTNCINAGFIRMLGGQFDTTIAGIIGQCRMSAQKRILSNNINVGIIDGLHRPAIVNGDNNIIAINCYYDKQMNVFGGMREFGTSVGINIPGQVEGRLTRNMVGRKLASLLGDIDWTYVEGATLIQSLYPQLKVFSESPDERQSDASKVGATPIFLYDGIKD
ncbi:MAG: hypothetical protein FWG85_00570, partial [Bacteroidetes bacterium]|nr:hypothetical protein [Bacteroidota bacterium]